MRALIILLSLMILSCRNAKNIDNTNRNLLYKVIKIDSINKWKIIYATRNDSLFKIVSKNYENNNCAKIQKKHFYAFQLNSRKENAPEINGLKLKPVNYLDIECYGFDENTRICIEPKKGIYDLYFAKNLKGLCIEN